MAKAARYHVNGGPEVLQVEEVPDPQPGPGEVVIEVAAAGINPFDAKARTLTPAHVPMAPLPRTVASDVAGTVVSVGELATYWDGTPVRELDEVAGSAEGSAATCARASVSQLVRVPGTVPAEIAGGLWTAGLTALALLKEAPPEAGGRVLVGGASGAVGLVLAQLAVRRGARVVGTASTRNFRFLRSLGVEPVEYGAGLAERLRPFAPFSAVYDAQGKDAILAGLELGTAPDRIVEIAYHEGVEELGIRGTGRGDRTAENFAGLLDLIANGALVLPVAASFPLEQVQEAFRLLEGSHPPGKIVLLPRS